LIKAARSRNNAVIKILITHKADLTATDATGATALEIAERSGWTDTADLLKKAGAK
jgi:ankyrin repeat protein